MSSHHALLAQPNAALHALLDANLQLPPEYRDQLTNHLPMALHALHALSADPQRLRDFFTSYSERFQCPSAPAPAAEPHSTDVDGPSWRGPVDAYPALLTRFQRRLACDGPQATLRSALPALLPGVAAAAFHGAIRTAHAVQAGHTGELAAALAYWAWRWQALAPPPAVDARVDLGVWASRLVEQAPTWRSSGPLISIRMNEASRSALYLAWAGALRPAPTVQQRIAELAGLAVARYVAKPNFTVLHMVTGMHALRTLLPWIEDSTAVQATLAHSFVAAYLAAGVSPLPAPPEPQPRSWPEVIGAALASDDDHVIKLVHACREEAAAYGEGLYLRAATLATAASLNGGPPPL